MKRTTLILLATLIGCATLAVRVDSHPTMPVPAIHVEPAAPSSVPEHPTFNKDVAPIIYHQCTSCHRPGQIGPFPLTSYAEVKRHATQIGKVTLSRQMPPWKPEAGWGEFVGDRHLSDSDVAIIQGWIHDGKPEGNGTAATPPAFADTWTLGPPDLIVEMPKAFDVPADGPDVYHCFVLPLPFKNTTYVSAVEFQPDNRKAVHHALLFLDTSGQARRKQEQNGGDGYPSFGGPGFRPTSGLGGWAPGVAPQRLPEGVVRAVRPASDLVMQLHMHPTGKSESVRCRVGIYLAHGPVSTVVGGMAMGTLAVDIPAGDAHYEVHDQFTLPVDITLYEITPHAHLLCHDVEAVATRPDGTVLPLIKISRWDFNWQGQYVYKHPLNLPQGTRLDVVFHYDNSDANPRNPNRPPKEVQFGEQTSDEMAFLFMGVAPDRPGDVPVLRSAVGRHFLENAMQILGHPNQWKRFRQLVRQRQSS